MSSEELISAAVHGLQPVPLASHDDVVRDRMLFNNTLRSFHFDTGTKFQVPVIGGKELDLHLLYAEVTSRGGYDKVVMDKKWREISSVFDFSPTTTSASYALRKHYFALLYRYERLYFFRIQAPVLGSTAAIAGPGCFNAVGCIEGKFESGYIVSLKIGDETLNGVLYHPAPPPTTTSTAIVPYSPGPLSSDRRTKRRKADPRRPKPNRSAYNFFFAAKHASLKSEFPNRERDFTKMIGEAWNNLSPQDRVVYQNEGLKDKERYQREMAEYKEKLRMELLN